MAGILLWGVFKTFESRVPYKADCKEKALAWAVLVAADILAILPAGDFPGSMSTAFAFALLFCSAVLFFAGLKLALKTLPPALWCCVFMPYHEELMLLLSYPLRLSATLVSAGLLKVCGIAVVYSGTSLGLPEVDISITDACSGINQLDAFLLVAFLAVHIFHRKTLWKCLHFAFIVPALIMGNSLRIVLTVLLYRWYGEVVLQNTWHIALGYVQIGLALLIFLAVGKIFAFSDTPEKEVCS
jgi:exosortase